MRSAETETSQPQYWKLQFQGRFIFLDEEGYLVNDADWSEDLAAHLASLDGITLTEDHWQVIRFIHSYYIRFQGAPMPRIIIKRLNQQSGAERFSVKALYALFPESPLRRAIRYAGIPRPAESS